MALMLAVVMLQGRLNLALEFQGNQSSLVPETAEEGADFLLHNVVEQTGGKGDRPSCPKCGSTEVRRWGKGKTGKQRWMCDRSHRFTEK